MPSASAKARFSSLALTIGTNMVESFAALVTSAATMTWSVETAAWAL